MQTAQAQPYRFTAVDAGVDWITCTARGKDARKPFLAQGEAILKEEAGRGVEITSARLRDYVGWRAPGVYLGTRREDDICVLSSSHAARLWQSVARHSTNVSRIDLQVTVWTHGEQPTLSRWYYQRLKRAKPSRGRPRSLSLIQTFPQGDTLYVGKRQSDYFGRCYDFASAHSQGPPRTLWRYEVECKRHLAARHCAGLLGSDSPRSYTESAVAHWYNQRGLQATWSHLESPHSEGDATEAPLRDVLRWFDTSLSKTVASAIRRHGLPAVLEALHLSGYVIPK